MILSKPTLNFLQAYIAIEQRQQIALQYLPRQRLPTWRRCRYAEPEMASSQSVDGPPVTPAVQPHVAVENEKLYTCPRCKTHQHTRPTCGRLHVVPTCGAHDARSPAVLRLGRTQRLQLPQLRRHPAQHPLEGKDTATKRRRIEASQPSIAVYAQQPRPLQKRTAEAPHQEASRHACVKLR